MMKSVVGVDLGSTALKVVELRGTWKGFEVVKTAERRLPTDTGVTLPAGRDGAGPQRIIKRPRYKTYTRGECHPGPSDLCPQPPTALP